MDLSFNGLGKEGASALGKALKENTVLEELNVRYEYLVIRLFYAHSELQIQFRSFVS